MNKFLTINIHNVTLEEIWSGFKARVRHFNVFDSITYTHVIVKIKTKLDDRKVKIIFLSYRKRGYKLFNPTTKKVIVSKDVTFVEDKVWNFDTEEQYNSQRCPIAILGEEETQATIPIVNGEVSPVDVQNLTPQVLQETGRPRKNRQQLVRL